MWRTAAKAWLHYFFGRVLLRAGCRVRAARQFEKALLISPRTVEVRTYLAWTLWELQRFDDSIREYRAVVLQTPEDAGAHLRLASALQHLTRHSEAIIAFRAAIERDPQNPVVYFNASASYLAVGQNSDALAAARRAAVLDPDNVEYAIDLGAILADLGHWVDAVDVLEGAVRRQPHFLGAYNLGVALAELGRHQEAEAAFRKALQLESSPTDVRVRLALTLRDQLRFGEATTVLQEASKSGGETGEILTAQASVLQAAGQMVQAIATARHAVQRFPDASVAHAGLGLALIAAERPAEALEFFDRALQLQPQCLDYLANRGGALSLLDRHDEAVEMFNEIEARDLYYFDRHRAWVEHVERSRKEWRSAR